MACTVGEETNPTLPHGHTTHPLVANFFFGLTLLPPAAIPPSPECIGLFSFLGYLCFWTFFFPFSFGPFLFCICGYFVSWMLGFRGGITWK